MLLEQCVKLCGQVRQHFKEGYKSGNKGYDGHEIEKQYQGADLQSRIQKATKRNTDLYNSRAHRVRPGGDVTDHLEMAYHLLHMRNASGNCLEMAVLAAFFAVRDYNVNASELMKGSLKPPGDHAFCLIGPAGTVQSLAFHSVKQFTESPLAAKVFIVDPWLNTACRANQYLMCAKQKLQDWQTDCKRITWNGQRGDTPGWYSPLGEYAHVFENRAPVVLTRFTGFTAQERAGKYKHLG
jgi:hypothetical protein